jgi:hypothetical protein
MKKARLVVLVLIAALIVAGWVGSTYYSAFAYYQRIQPGMNLNEVERLLGHPGREVRESELARAVDRSLPVGHPQRVKPVISGERYVRWEKGSGYIIVSLRGEAIAEKWYWEPGPDR